MVSVVPDQTTTQDNSHGTDVPSLDEDEAAALPDGDDEGLTIAEPVPNNEPFSIGIRVRNEDLESPPIDAACTRSNFFRAVVLDAEPVINVNSRPDEMHPNQLNRAVKGEIEAYRWQRFAFRCCVIVSFLGVGLGVGFGMYGSSREGTKQDEQQLQAEPPILDNDKWEVTHHHHHHHQEVTPLASGETCTDDPSWQGMVPGTTCEVVALNPKTHCRLFKGFRKGGQVVTAQNVCLKSCTACDGIDPNRLVVPTTKPEGLECINSKEWHSFVDRIDCDRVKTDPSTFCGFVGKKNHELAFRACPESCFEECV